MDCNKLQLPQLLIKKLKSCYSYASISSYDYNNSYEWKFVTRFIARNEIINIMFLIW